MSHDSDKKDKKIGATELVVSSTVIGLTASAAAYQKMKKSIDERNRQAQIQARKPFPSYEPDPGEPVELTDFSNENGTKADESLAVIKELDEFEEK